jgi:uncharacterized protein (DUF2345 family)
MQAPLGQGGGAQALVEEEPERDLLDEVDLPVASAEVVLTSGRRYDLQAGEDADRLVIRARGGEVVLRIEVTDAGPVLSFSGASIDLEATRRLRMSAQEVSIEARGDVSLSAGGSLRETVGADHHTRVAGDERVEAANVQLQANTGGVGVRAMQRIALDGEHVGLNDEAMPRPFGWSEIAGDEESA